MRFVEERGDAGRGLRCLLLIEGDCGLLRLGAESGRALRWFARLLGC